MNNIFHGDKLRLARLLNGLTQQQLGNAISASRQFVHQMESGRKQPSNEVLDVLCEELGVESSFFLKAIQNDMKFEQCHFRKRKTTPVNLANRVLAYNTLFEDLTEIINFHIELPPIDIPDADTIFDKNSMDIEYSNSQIEIAAEYCRKHWSLGTNTPILNIIRVLENAGIIVTEFTGVSDKVDALSFNRKYPVIVRNAEKGSSCRVRFDLAHECGHLVLHDGVETGDNITESEADRFASAFIFPRSAFVKEFPDFKKRRLDWNKLYELKVRWGMSLRALLYRAKSLNLITAGQYRSANIYLSKNGYTKTEPHDDRVPRESPELLYNALDIINSEVGISTQSLSKSIGISVDLFKTITSISEVQDNSANNVTSLF